MNGLRILFDGRALRSPAGGVRRYGRELLAALATVAPDLSLLAIGGDRASGVSSVPAGLTLPTNLGWSAVGLPLAARRVAYDVFHAPAYTAPLWGVRPLVLTIHDVSYARHPEWYPHRSDPVRRWFYGRSARTADWILTDSEFSRREIEAAYGIAPARIAVVPLGVGPPFVAGEPAGLPAAVGSAGAFALHVGDVHVRRNLETALAAVLEVRRRQPRLSALRLVLAGADRGEVEKLRSLASAAGSPDALVFAASPSDDVLLALYRGAMVFVYPSRYEGFGLPVLEAMACGLPVVAARAGAIPEVAGHAALLADPDDVRGFAEAIEHVGLERNRREAMRAASIARAATFTWARTALATLDVYRRAAHRPS